MNALTGRSGLTDRNGIAIRPRLRRRPLVIGLINNMPDSALAATRRQWSSLVLDPRHDQGEVVLRCYALPEVMRGAPALAEIRQTYVSLHALRADPPDALIISGAAPTAPGLREEPYWHSLTEILDWAQARGMGLILSCLAAHAAVLHADGIGRVPLARKCSGLFRQDIRARHPLLWGLERDISTPHSRWNDLPEAALAGAGYRVLTASAEAGVDMFADPCRESVLYLNGHPEYDADTLLREYRRDVARYLAGDQPAYPDIPAHCFGAEAEAAFGAFRAAAVADRTAARMDDFPNPCIAASAPWQGAALTVIGNWLWHVRAGARHHHAA